jgi:hypothetical protein
LIPPWRIFVRFHLALAIPQYILFLTHEDIHFMGTLQSTICLQKLLRLFQMLNHGFLVGSHYWQLFRLWEFFRGILLRGYYETFFFYHHHYSIQQIWSHLHSLDPYPSLKD